MKRYFIQAMRCLMVALAVVGGVVSCTTPPPEQQEPEVGKIVVSTPTMDFDWTYCEQSFDVSSPKDFIVTSNATWIDFDQTEFSAGDYTVTVATMENPVKEIRLATITISAEGLEDVEISVLQNPNGKQEVFKAITERVEVDSDSQTAYIEVNSGMEFTVATVADWITVPDAVFGPGESVSVPIEVARNVGELREAKVSLKSNQGNWIDVIVEQGAFKPMMTVPTDTLYIDGKGGSLQLNIASDIDYKVTSPYAWIVPDSATYVASTNSVVTLTVDENSYTDDRVGKVKIDGGNARLQFDVYVRQSGRVPATDNEIKSITLRKSANKGLAKDYVLTPDENGVFSCHIPAIKSDAYINISNKDVRFDKITPFDIENAVVEIESNAYRIFDGYDLVSSGQTTCDLSTNKVLKAVAESGDVRTYQIKVTYFTGLPIVYINLDSNKEVASKEVYEGGTIQIVGAGDVPGLPKQRFEMHGRGNSSWGTFRKKPSYTFKLDSKQSVGGMPDHKKWVMIGNYRDKTLLRNEVAW